jgi:hypothetical protein
VATKGSIYIQPGEGETDVRVETEVQVAKCLTALSTGQDLGLEITLGLSLSPPTYSLVTLSKAWNLSEPTLAPQSCYGHHRHV